MADAAAARREARRKRILENSSDRLKLITGKEDTESLEKPSYVSEENVNTSLGLLSDGFLNPSEECIKKPTINGCTPVPTLEFLPINFGSAGDGDTNISTLQPTAGTPEVKPHSIYETLFTRKFDVVLLSLFIQIVFCLFVTSSENIYHFVPLIIYTVTKLLIFPVRQSSNIADALLLLHGLSPDRVQKIMFFVEVFTTLSQDVCIYLFTAICIQCIFVVLGISVGS